MPIIGQTISTPGIILTVECDASVSIGDWIRLDAMGIAYPAQADDINNSNVIGVAESKPATTVCSVRVSGVTQEIFSGLDTTKEYFLSDTSPGDMVVQGGAIPTASGSIVLKLGKPFSDKRFVINIGDRIKRA